MDSLAEPHHKSLELGEAHINDPCDCDQAALTCLTRFSGARNTKLHFQSQRDL